MVAKEPPCMQANGAHGTTGFHLAGHRRDDARCVFVCRDRPSRRHALRAFHGDQASRSPLRLAGAIREIKALLHHA
jgi:hypothetical protein